MQNDDDLEELSKLSGKYGLRIQVLPNVMLVYSKFHNWMTEYYNDIITLYHFHGKCNHDKHLQFKFRKRCANYEDVFRYIKQHDDYVLRKYKPRSAILTHKVKI